MVYVTEKLPPMYHQMTLEELLFDQGTVPSLLNKNETNTRTYKMDEISPRFRDKIDVAAMIRRLRLFNQNTESIRQKPRHELYDEFFIPKRSGGLRRIDAPKDELKNALWRLKTMFEEFGALYHTSAFAYMKGRGTLACLKRHQANESRWYAKYDLRNFFGSTTPDFVMRMFSMVFPFSEIIKDEDGKRELEAALDLAFLDGGLPQGTPVSPMITNIMMIPIDFELTQGLRDFHGQRFCNTRYADDFQVSSKYDFRFRDVEQFIVDTLASFDAPFQINRQKTRYGSSAGSNWNLGLMLNKDNEITVGNKKKRRFQAMLASYIMDKKNGHAWDIGDVMTMEGYRNYYRMVEGETIDRIVEHTNNKFGVNVVEMIRGDISHG